MIDKVSGRIAYAVVGFGGFLGIGNRHYPLPWEKLKYDTNMGGFVVNLDKRTLEGAPSYSDADTVGWDDPTWGKGVYDYYGAHPYLGPAVTHHKRRPSGRRFFVRRTSRRSPPAP